MAAGGGRNGAGAADRKQWQGRVVLDSDSNPPGLASTDRHGDAAL